MNRGEVYWADLVPRSGSEQQGRRPVVVISHDAFNRRKAGGRSLLSHSQLHERRPAVGRLRSYWHKVQLV